MDLQGRGVYVTGATGFLGTHLVDALLARGARITALVRAPDAAPARTLAAKGVTLQRGDVTDLMSIDASGCDVLFHNAAFVGFGLLKKRRAQMFETNVEGTRNALSAAERAGVRKFVHTSSIAVIGDTRGEVATETFPRSPWAKSRYEETKLEAHLLAQAHPSLEVALPMPGVIMGLGSPFDPLLSRFAKGKLPAVPSGDGPTGFVHAADVAEGLCLAAEKGRGPYLLVEDNLRFAEFFGRLGETWGVPVPKRRVSAGLIGAAATVVQGAYHLVGKTPPLSREHVVGLKAHMSYSSEKARSELGWAPRMWERFAAERDAYRSL